MRLNKNLVMWGCKAVISRQEILNVTNDSTRNVDNWKNCFTLPNEKKILKQNSSYFRNFDQISLRL